jgi:outer membrane lipoprotein-sorting protein
LLSISTYLRASPKGRIPLRFVLLFLGLAGFLISGCGPKPKLLPEDRTPEKVLRCARENQLHFDTFACLMNLKLEGEDAKFSGTIEFFYKHPDTFSFYPRTLFGMGAFRARGVGDSLTIYFPKRNEFYAGSFSEFERTGLWSWGISLNMLLDLILARTGLAEDDAEFVGTAEGLFLYELESEDWVKQYSIDSRRCRVTQSRWQQKSGGESYQIEYRNFTARDHAEIPKVIKIRSKAEDSAQIKFLERKFNPSVPPKKFELRIPADARQVVFEPGEG